MQKIEINTTQNVIIQYELALLSDRIFAFLIDFVIIIISWLILSAFFSLFIESSDLVFYFVGAPIFFFYTLINENITNGQSIGKKALDIKIIKINGDEPKLGDFTVRWVFRMIDIYFSIGTLASLLVSSSDNKQRLGDIIAGTAIVKLKPNLKLSLKDVLKIQSKDDYEPTYPEVKKFNDEQMLLIKNTLDRVNKFPNKAQRESLDLLYQKVEANLNLNEQIKSDKAKVKFFKTLISDYVVLTR
ncbi:MAG: RDD family protein [Flammeovirgaceae bacterium]|nr:RDD family protein [Flammeovirgaceae bacterium]